MNPDHIIVYRSRGEELSDQFWYDTAIPWIVENPLLCLGILSVGCMLLILSLARPNRRFKRR